MTASVLVGTSACMQGPFDLGPIWRLAHGGQQVAQPVVTAIPRLYALSGEAASTVVFWVVRGKPSPGPNHRLLGQQRGEELFCPLPEFEALVSLQDQPLNKCPRLLTTRFPHGFDGYAPFGR